MTQARSAIGAEWRPGVVPGRSEAPPSRVRNVEGELGHSLRGAIPLTSAWAAILGLRIPSERAAQLAPPELQEDGPVLRDRSG